MSAITNASGKTADTQEAAVNWGHNRHEEISSHTKQTAGFGAGANEEVETEGTDNSSLNSELPFHFKIILFGKCFRNGAVRTSKNIFPP